MQKQDYIDRRIFARIPIKVSLRLLCPHTDKESRAQTSDISAKGIGLVVEEKLQPLTPIEMWLQMPNQDQPYYARGEVVWSKPTESNKYRVGINLERADLMGMSQVLRRI